MDYLIDTNIIIDYTRHSQSTVEFLDSLPNFSTSIVCAGELYQGARNKEELRDISLLVKQFEVLHLDEEIGDMALNLIRTYNLSHGLHLTDALIAATALYHKMPLVSNNKKHFSFIENLKLKTL